MDGKGHLSTYLPTYLEYVQMRGSIDADDGSAPAQDTEHLPTYLPTYLEYVQMRCSIDADDGSAPGQDTEHTREQAVDVLDVQVDAHEVDDEELAGGLHRDEAPVGR